MWKNIEPNTRKQGHVDGYGKIRKSYGLDIEGYRRIQKDMEEYVPKSRDIGRCGLDRNGKI